MGEIINFIKYHDKKIEYSINRGKRKYIYICIDNGEVIVKAPLNTSLKEIEEAAENKKKWIYEKVSAFPKRKYKEYINGEIFKILGKEYILSIIYKDIKTSECAKTKDTLYVYLPIKYKILEKSDEQKIKVKEAIYIYYFTLAQEEVDKSMKKMINLVGVAPNEYRIKNLKKTWGNCSSSKKISISKDIVIYSQKAIEYVCLHELCHLVYSNHSKLFWNMVSFYMNDYREAEEELKYTQSIE
ncbi:MAG: SprT family zinc-dependent metalloprotease [Clostridia bacterium]